MEHIREVLFSVCRYIAVLTQRRRRERVGGVRDRCGYRDEARSDYELRVMGNRTRELQRVRRWRDDRRSVGDDEPDEQER